MKKKIIVAVSGIVVVVLAVFLFIRKNKVSDTMPTMYAQVTGLESTQDNSQSYWSARGHNFARGENGYYFLNTMGNSLMFFDEQTKEYFPVCAKPECTHNSMDCNAYLGKGQYLLQSIYYYKGNIYLFKINNGNANLTQISADGSSRKDLCDVMPTDGGSSMYMVFNNDMAYIYDCWGNKASGTESTEKIRRVSLKDGNVDTVYEYTGTNCAIDNAKGFGNKLFFLVNEGVKDEKTGVTVMTTKGLYTLDYATGDVTLVTDGDIYDYYVNTDTQELYYYISGSGLYREKLGENNRELIYTATDETGYCRMSYDGKYIYLDNNEWAWNKNISYEQIKCFVLKTDGTVVNTIPCPNFLSIYYGDDKYMFANKPGDGAMNGLVYIDKSNIETVQEWTQISKSEISIVK